MLTTEETDPYRVLGLPTGASKREVKAQFRRLAKQHHPDLNPGSAWHQEQFRRVHDAYEMIEAIQRAGASAPVQPHFPESDGKVIYPSETPWVHKGDAAHVGGPSFVSEAARPHRHRRSANWAWSGASKGELVTWWLAAVAMLLVGLAIAGPHIGGAFAASSQMSRSPGDATAADILPVVLASGTDAAPDLGVVHDDTGVVTAFPAGESASASSQGMGLDAAAPTASSSRAEARPAFAVDTKYTQVDPTYTAVNPDYTRVDVQVMGGSQQAGVDLKSVGIDPKLIRP